MKNRFGNRLASLSPPNPALRHVSLDASAYALRNPSTRPRARELLQSAAERGINIQHVSTVAASEVITLNPQLLVDAFDGKPQALAREIQTSVVNTLLADNEIKKAFSRSIRTLELRRLVSLEAQRAIEALMAEAKRRVEAAQRLAVQVDIGLTAQELASVPEPMISHVELVIEMRNYEPAGPPTSGRTPT